MFRRSVFSSLAALAGAGLFFWGSSAQGSLVEKPVGTGTESASVVFNWPDGFDAVYNVQFGTNSSSSVDGYTLTNDAATDDPGNLNVQWIDYGTPGNPDYFLNYASYTGGHVGDGDTYSYPDAQENYWHEWVNLGSGWVFAAQAAQDYALTNGQEIGWVFGSDAIPVPEPASLSMGVLAAALLSRRRSR